MTTLQKAETNETIQTPSLDVGLLKYVVVLLLLSCAVCACVHGMDDRSKTNGKIRPGKKNCRVTIRQAFIIYCCT